MAIGQRIKFFRNRIGMTQKQLGEKLGFHGKTSDVRVAQYESEVREPKINLVKDMAYIFDVSTRALNVPNIDSYIGLMHTLFTIEDMYGLKIGEVNGAPCLCLDPKIYPNSTEMYSMLNSWQKQSAKLESGEITKEQYDEWRYKYPELDTSKRWARIPSQEISDSLLEEFRKEMEI